MAASLHDILETKRVDSQAFLMARYHDDVSYAVRRISRMAAKNDEDYQLWKTTRDYILFLYNNFPHRIKGLIKLAGYTRAQVDIIWDIAHREKKAHDLRLMAAFSEWDK